MESFTQEEVAVVQKQLKDAQGMTVGINTTPDSKISSLILNVLYIADDESDLGVGRVEVSDGVFTPAMKEVHAVAVAAHGGEPGDEDYPEQLDPQAAWSAAKVKLNDLIADPNVTTLEEMAEELVSLLAQIGPAGQKWGRKILLDAYDAQVK